MNLPSTILGFSIAKEKMLVENEVARCDTFPVRIEGEITSRLSVRVLKNRSSGSFWSERSRGSESALSPVKRIRLRRMR